MKVQKVQLWIACVLLGLLTACAAPESPATSAGTSAESTSNGAKVVPELVIAQTAEVPTLDAQLNWTMIGRNIYYQMYGYLTRHDKNMVVVPELAESWELIDDLTMRWHLREGVTFHNGEPFNAEAMKYSLERILDEDTGAPWRAVLTWIDHIEVVDEYTVDVTAQFPTTAQLLEVGRMPMVPPQYLAEVGAEAFAEAPISAGPWKFVEWIKGDRVVLERNMDYWSGPPSVERLVFRVVPEATTALAELQVGTLDIANIAPEACDMLNASDNAHCVAARSIQNVRLVFTNDTEDINVRKAVAHAVNVDSIIENIMNGQAVKSVGPLSQLVWGADPDLSGYAYDPDMAQQLLDEAGYAPGELTIPLHFAEGRIAKGREVAEAIAGDLEKVGIMVDLQPAEYGVWFDDFYGGTMSGMSLSASTATTADPNQMFRDYRLASCVGYYCSEELDAYLVPVNEIVDPDERLPLVRAAEDYVFDEVLWIQLYDVDLLYGVSNKVDWEPVPNDIKWILSAQPR